MDPSKYLWCKRYPQNMEEWHLPEGVSDTLYSNEETWGQAVELTKVTQPVTVGGRTGFRSTVVSLHPPLPHLDSHWLYPSFLTISESSFTVCCVPESP